MSIRQPDWSSIDTAVLCVLIAGYPHPIVHAGATLTAVTWTDDPDPAWHVGTSGLTSKPWLANTGPLVIDERASPGRQVVQIAPVPIVLHDVEGAVTAAMYARAATSTTYLTASLAAGATTATVESTTGFPSSGTIHVGREAITYSGKTATTFTGLTRGAHGTRDKLHAVTTDGLVRPQVYGNPADDTGAVLDGLPSLKGRRLTVWLLSMSGTTATDPVCMYDGRVGAGTTLDGPDLRLNVVHVITALGAKLRQTRVLLAGYNHHGEPCAAWGASTRTPESDGQLLSVMIDRQSAPDGRAIVSLTAADPGTGGSVINGWCSTAEEFFTRWNNRAATILGGGGGYTVTIGLDGSGRLFPWVSNGSSGIETHVRIGAAWLPGGVFDYPDADSTSTRDAPFPVEPLPPFPAAWVPLSRPIYLSATDAGQIPSTLTGTTAGADGGSYQFGLSVKVGERERRVLLASASGNTVTGSLVDPTPGLLDGIVTQPTAAELTLDALGDRWWGALRYGVLAGLDGWQGIDHMDDSVAWDDLIATARRTPATLPSARRYRIASEKDSFLSLLEREAAIGGFVVCMRRGRISIARIEESAATEPSIQTVTDDVLADIPAMVEAPDGTVTSYKLRLPDDASIRVVDVVAEDEAGGGEEIDADASTILRDRVRVASVVGAVTRQATITLGAFSRPYRVATLPLTVAYAGVGVGDVILVSEWLLPDGAGGRGLSEVPCTVIGRRVRLGGESNEGAVDLDVLVSQENLAGYAPEVLIDSISGTTLGVDVTFLGAVQGPRGFCDELLTDGTPRTDGGASFFSPDDAVSLHELDNASPATPFTSSVVSVDTATGTIELASAPGATWETLAATPGKVLLAFDGHASSETSQRRYCYIADRSTLLIGSTAARRYG